MHELSIADNILTTVARTLGTRQNLRKVFLTLGPLSGVSAEALAFCFSEIARERGYDEAELVMHRPKARVGCRQCGIEYETDDFFGGCPECGSLERTIFSGDEFTLDSLEVQGD